MESEASVPGAPGATGCGKPSKLAKSSRGNSLTPHVPASSLKAWLGGSILASLPTLEQMWVSKADYDEHGSSIVNKRCP
eukprot:scaffold922_cov327-Pinguiococcus_pyrenoidosus.AAC.14